MNTGQLELTLDLLVKTILDTSRLLISSDLEMTGRKSQIKLVIGKFLNDLFFGILDGDWRASGPDSSISHLVQRVAVGWWFVYSNWLSICLFVSEICSAGRQPAAMPSKGAIIAFVLSILLGTLYAPLDSNTLFLTRSSEGVFQQAKNVLLVTAHPDDEAMFFAPTILSLANRQEIALFHVCLSNGNADGLGETRKAELGYSLDILGISRQNRWLVDNPYVRTRSLFVLKLTHFLGTFKIILRFNGTPKSLQKSLNPMSPGLKSTQYVSFSQSAK